MSEVYLSEFYRIEGLDPREMISKELFIEKFSEIKKLKFIRFIEVLTSMTKTPDGETILFMNFEDNRLNKNLLRRITEI